MHTTAAETTTAYVFTVTTDDGTFVYEWCKNPPDGVDLQDYLQSCKVEAERLAAHEIEKQQPPTPIDL